MLIPRLRGSRRLVAHLLVLLLLMAAGAAVVSSAHPDQPASVAWAETSPEAEGFDGGALRSMAADLAERGTKALLVARHGRLVFEWYAPDFSWNHRHYTAAMTKGVAAAPALLAAAGEGLLSLDDPVADWVPEWRTHADLGRITLRDLAFHDSGLESVDFDAGRSGLLPGWKQRYYDHPEERFRLALDSAALLHQPRLGLTYSGVGYYVLSYVVSRALADQSTKDIPSFLETKVYAPIGIPRNAWSIGYARSDTIDGLSLTHFGSGGEYTARAAARVGQLMLQRGCWEGRQLLEPDLVATALGWNGVTRALPGVEDSGHPASGAGWWSNVNGAWASGPARAVAALGQGPQILWVDPGLELVVVRMGSGLAAAGQSREAAIDQYLLHPLYDALEGTESWRADRVSSSTPARNRDASPPACGS